MSLRQLEARRMHAVEPAPDPLPDEVADRFARWRRASFEAQARTLEACLDRAANAAAAWVQRGHEVKGLPADHAEEWLVGPVPLIRGLRLWARSLRHLAEHRSPVRPDQCTRTADGRVAVQAFPSDPFDRAMFRGFAAHVHMAPELTPEAVVERAGATARARSGGVSAVLGAGNVASIPPLDALTLCVNEQTPAIVKLSPVNAWVRPYLEASLGPLIDAGAMSFVEGGADVGERLIHHPQVTRVHLTGSNATHDRIVWGADDPERVAREGRPALDKTVSSELGNVSPVAIVPGTYSDVELDFVAHQVVAMLTNNASFNCNAARVLVLAEGWHQKEALFRRLENALRRVPTRRAYYPGARERFEASIRGREVERIGRESAERLPWTLIRGLDPTDAEESLFRTEAFCPVLSTVELDVPNAVAFIDEATEFMNERLWGTLNAMWFVSKEQHILTPVRGALDDAIARLRYGTVGVNHWPALGFAWVTPPWGGHPSSSLDDVQSGRGWVHNTLLLEGIEKTVIRGPMPTRPKPVWFADHRHAHHVGRRMVAMERRPSWLKVPGLAFSALLG